jgi:hypothetical protein
MLFAGLLVGKVFDDHGPSLLLAGGTFLHVFGLMMTSVSDKYVQFLLGQAVCSALGASMVFYPAVSCVSSALMTPCPRVLSTLMRPALLGIDLVPCEARCCSRSCRRWRIARRCRFPHDGDPAHSPGWLRLGNAYLCFPDIGTALFRHVDGSLSFAAK